MVCLSYMNHCRHEGPMHLPVKSHATFYRAVSNDQPPCVTGGARAFWQHVAGTEAFVGQPAISVFVTGSSGVLASPLARAGECKIRITAAYSPLSICKLRCHSCGVRFCAPSRDLGVTSHCSPEDHREQDFLQLLSKQVISGMLAAPVLGPIWFSKFESPSRQAVSHESLPLQRRFL